MPEQYLTGNKITDMDKWLKEDEGNLDLLNNWVQEVIRIFDMLARGFGSKGNNEVERLNSSFQLQTNICTKELKNGY